ncbi:hypothetical protein [Parafrankia discariae]|uniref:hypothetical protein n=1 Tax=Parafrankia discariae TaxID=365528 RepID=UPI0003A7128B|nr:hypothetical protein [Parafrankia discariae]
MFAAVVAHLVLAAVLPALTGRLGRAAFLLAAVAPAATFGWLVIRLPALLDAAGGHGAPGGDPPVETLTWAPTVGLEIVFRLAPLALLMALLVTGVGAAVLVYSFAYHAPHASDGGAPVPGSARPGRAGRVPRCSRSRAPCWGWSWPTTCSRSTCSGSSPPSSPSC